MFGPFSKLTSKSPYASSVHDSLYGGRSDFLRCNYLAKYFENQPVKELHQCFPCLLSNIFGYDGTRGWGLAWCNRKTMEEEFTTVLSFLSPNGPMFQLISKLEEENFLYEFPINFLPLPSKQLLMEGVVPSFYVDRVQLDIVSGQGVPDHILLCIHILCVFFSLCFSFNILYW